MILGCVGSVREREREVVSERVLEKSVREIIIIKCKKINILLN